ncbi:MAG: type II toxin-antitoxin system RelE/ParE family toxin [Acidobacteria bacterium]|nr:type II toxin-antitoxin system RelE/ParE family toxin [Acidobacteriota bacterium]
MRTLRDPVAEAHIARRIARLAEGNPGQHRVLDGGVAELKIDHGPGYRVYYTERGPEIVVLLIGGTKKTQAVDIATAQAMRKALASDTEQ